MWTAYFSLAVRKPRNNTFKLLIENHFCSKIVFQQNSPEDHLNKDILWYTLRVITTQPSLKANEFQKEEKMMLQESWWHPKRLCVNKMVSRFSNSTKSELTWTIWNKNNKFYLVELKKKWGQSKIDEQFYINLNRSACN